MVHGACTSSGCYAMTDDGVAEVYAVAREALAAGQPAFQVQALPFRMTPRNFALHRNDPNMPFWRNLKTGHRRFRGDAAAAERVGLRRALSLHLGGRPGHAGTRIRWRRAFQETPDPQVA